MRDTMTGRVHTGPLCPCGHPVASHYFPGCLDNQWFEGPPEDNCPCELTGDEAALVAQATAEGSPK